MKPEFIEWSCEFFRTPSPQLCDPYDQIFVNVLRKEHEQAAIQPKVIGDDPFSDFSCFADSCCDKLDLSITPYVKDFLITCLCDAESDILMYLAALSYASHQYNIRPITVRSLANVFTNGFPAKPQLTYLWSCQKTGDSSRNLLLSLTSLDF